MRIASFAFLWEAILSDSVYGGPPQREGWELDEETGEDFLSQLWKERGCGQWWRRSVCCCRARISSSFTALLWGVSSLQPPASCPLPSMAAPAFSPGLGLSLEHRDDTLGEERAQCQCSREKIWPLSETIASPWAFLFSWLIRPMRTFWEMLAGQKEAFKY